METDRPDPSPSCADLRERTLASEPLLQGGFLQVWRDEVRLPDGGQARREYIRHPGAAVVVPLLQDGRGGWRVVLER